MNQQLYRIIFNRARGQWMAVSEVSTGHGRGSGRSGRPARRPRGRRSGLPRALTIGDHPPRRAGSWRNAGAALLVLSCAASLQAQVKADGTAPGAQRPTVLTTANGVPLVNIQTPSAAGVSRNRYEQMDVDGRGLILNNARTPTASSLGGMVPGNPWLARGEARVILNEVRSSQPTRLHGVTEVAGRTAEVIVANPSGLHIDGAGFLNAHRVTLTTGTPQWGGDGNVEGFDVRQGQVRVEGRGLDASQAGYTALLARATALDGGVWGQSVELQGGLDSTALGGVYARRITLVSSEGGLGVHHQGRMMADQLTLDVQGRLHNSGTLQALADGDDALVARAGELHNEGWMVARGSVALQAQRLSGGEGSVTAAGWPPAEAAPGTPAASLRLQAPVQQQAGHLVSSGDLAATGAWLDFGKARMAAGHIHLEADRLDLGGAVLSGSESLTAHARQALGSRQAQLSAPRLELHAPTVDGTGAEWLHLGTSPWHIAAEQLTLDGARLGSNASAMTLRADAMNADGARIDHHEGDSLIVDAAHLSARGAQWRSHGAMHVQAGDADLSRAQLQAGSLTLQGDAVKADAAALTSAGSLRLTAGQWQQDGGALRANERLVMASTGSVALTGTQLAADQLQVSAGALDLSRAAATVRGMTELAVANTWRTDGVSFVGGELQAVTGDWAHGGGHLWMDGAASVRAQEIHQAGGLLQAGSWALVAERLHHGEDAQMVSSGTMQVEAGAWDQAGTLSAGGRLEVHAGRLDNTGAIQGLSDLRLHAQHLSHQGTLMAAKDLRLEADRIHSTGTLAAGWTPGGPSTHGGSVHVQAGDVLTHSGLVAAAGDVAVQGPSLDLRGSRWDAQSLRLLATGTDVLLDKAQVRLDGDFILNAAGLASLKGIAAQAGAAHWGGERIDHRGGSLSSAAEITVQARQLLNGEGGRLRAGGAALIGVGSMDNTGGAILSDGSLTLRASESLSNRGGSLLSAGTMTLSAEGSVHNSGGSIASRSADVQLEAADAFLNDGGTVAAAKDVRLTASRLDNRAGEVAGQNVQVLASGRDGQAGTIDNQGGRLLADESLQVRAGVLDNVGGRLLSAGSLHLALDGDHVHREGDHIAAAGDAHLTIGGHLTNEAKWHAGQSLAIAAQEISLASGSELSAGVVDLTAAGALSNRGLIDGDTVRLQATELSNVGGGRLFGDAITVRADHLLNGDEDGRAAVIASRGELTLDIDRTLVNRDGALLLSQGDMAISAQTLRNENAAIEAGGDLRLAVRDRVDNLSVHADAAASAGLQEGAASSGNQPPRVLDSLASISAGGDMSISAATVVNSGGTIDVRGDLDVQAGGVHNLNPYLQWAITESTERTTAFELPNGLGTYRPDEVRVLWGVKEFEFGWYSPWGSPAADSLEPFVHHFTPGQDGWSQDTYRRQLLLPSERYPHEIFGRYLGGDGGDLSGSAERGFAWLRSADYWITVVAENHSVELVKGQHYPHDDRVWRDFGITPGDDEALDRAMDAFYRDANRRLVGGFTFVDVTRTTQQAQVTQSSAGRIVVGGELSMRGGELVNHMSQVIGREGVDIQADRLRNEAVQVQLQDREEGGRYRTYNMGSSVPNTGIAHAAIHALTPKTETLTIPTVASTTLERPAIASRPEGPALEGADAQAAMDRIDQAWTSGSITAAPGSGLPPADAAAGGAGLGSLRPSSGPALPVGAGATGALQAVPPDLRLPTNSLHALRPSSAATHLVETDARFTGGQALSSDFLLNALSVDMQAAQKRLGDGAYEQRLVRDQLRRLTGSQYVNGQQTDEDLYRALMVEGASFGAQHQLQPGVALSAEQMALLTTDLVWLVEQTVSLPDGSRQQVLVPQVYIVPRAQDLTAEGALIAGQRVQVALSGELLNSGTLHAEGALDLSASSALHEGQLRGASVALTTRGDLTVAGGRLVSEGSLQLQAGGDLRLASTVAQAGTAQSQRTVLDRLASLEAGGSMVLTAGRDLTVSAADLHQQAADGGMTLQAGRDLALERERIASSDRWTFNAASHQAQSAAADVGSRLQAAGQLQLAAGQDLTARAAVIAGDRDVRLSAGRDLRLDAGQASTASESQWKETRREGWSKTTERESAFASQTWAQPSSVTGGSIAVAAGRDLAVTASELVADGPLTLAAGRDVALTAAIDTDRQETSRSVSTSGVQVADRGMGLSIGRQSASGSQASERQSVAGTTVGSLSGDVKIVAGGQYLQSGATVAALQGDIDITAARVDIESVAATSTQSRMEQSRQSGISVSAGSPVFDTARSLAKGVAGVGRADDLRAQWMDAAIAAGRLAQAPQTIAEQLATGGALSVQATVGSRASSSEHHTRLEEVHASRLEAGGQVRVQAQGLGADSAIRIQGADLLAGGDIQLRADGDVSLASSQERASSHSAHRSHSASIGGSAGLGTSGLSGGWTVQGGAASGRSDSEAVTQRLTRVDGATVSIHSGGDTSLRGAVVSGRAVDLEVGGDLRIESLQDVHRFDSRSHQTGVAASTGKLTGSAGAASARAEQLAVAEQSGIRAGDGGFRVNVAGQATLRGGVITSTDAAVQDGLNHLQAQHGLSLSDVRNHASQKSQALHVTAGQSTTTKGKQTTSGSLGVSGDSSRDQSTSHAAVSGLAGLSSARTGDDAPDGFTSLDAAAAQRQAQAQSERLQAFGAMAAGLIGDYAASKLAQATDVRAQADKETDPARREALAGQAAKLEREWGAEGSLRLAAHTAVGGLSGGLAGAAGAAAGTWTAPRVDALLTEAGIDPTLANALTAMASSAAGALAGGGMGATLAFNEVTGNYLTHKEQLQLKQQLAGCTTQACRDEARAQALQRSQLRNEAVVDACLDGGTDLCRAQLAKVQEHLADMRAHPDGTGQMTFQPVSANHIAQAEEKYRIGLQVMAHQAAQALGRPYVSPEELAQMGFLSAQEASDLQDIRAGTGADVLGALAMVDGASMRPQRPMAPGPTAAEIEAQRKLILEQRVHNNADRDGGAEPHSSHPNTESTLALRKKVEIDQSNGTSNPHYSDKHGPYVTLAQQYERAMKGTNPQTGKKGTPVDASKFFNATDMEVAIREAEALYAANPAQYRKGSVTVEFPRAVGEGYTGNTHVNRTAGVPVGDYRWTQSVVVRIDARTGKAFTAFPDMKSGVSMPDPLKGAANVH